MNCARVGVGSEPLQPPIAMTALPPLANSRLAALWSPVVAAAQRVEVALSSAASSELDELSAPGPDPPGNPPCPDWRSLPLVCWPNGLRPASALPPVAAFEVGPADGIEPECGVAAVSAAYAADPPPSTSKAATLATATPRRLNWFGGTMMTTAAKSETNRTA